MSSPSNKKFPLVLLAAAGLLAACAGGSGLVPVSQTYYDNSFTGDELGYASQFGAVQVYAKGGPLDDPRNVDTLVAILNQNHAAAQLEFARATAATTSAYSVVFAYGQPSTTGNYCDRRAEVPVTPAVGTPQVIGTFCLPGRLRSQAILSIAGAAGTMPSHDLLDGLVSALFSPDLNRRRGGQAYN